LLVQHIWKHIDLFQSKMGGKKGYLGMHQGDRQQKKVDEKHANEKALEAARAAAKAAGDEALARRNAIAAGRNVPDPDEAARAAAKEGKIKERKAVAKQKRDAARDKRAAGKTEGVDETNTILTAGFT
jgi:hypothetical protein